MTFTEAMDILEDLDGVKVKIANQAECISLLQAEKENCRKTLSKWREAFSCDPLESSEEAIKRIQSELIADHNDRKIAWEALGKPEGTFERSTVERLARAYGAEVAHNKLLRDELLQIGEAIGVYYEADYVSAPAELPAVLAAIDKLKLEASAQNSINAVNVENTTKLARARATSIKGTDWLSLGVGEFMAKHGVTSSTDISEELAIALSDVLSLIDNSVAAQHEAKKTCSPSTEELYGLHAEFARTHVASPMLLKLLKAIIDRLN